MSTVKFDASWVTESIKIDLWKDIQELDDLPVGSEGEIYRAALEAISKGRALNILFDALIAIKVSRNCAFEITHLLTNLTASRIDVARHAALGLNEGVWMYSGAPCYARYPHEDADLRRDEAHNAANGKRFPIDRGLLIDGRYSYPGRELGCKCTYRAIIFPE